jgi:glycosyltransferase involved in cell wall biosynthesis
MEMITRRNKTSIVIQEGNEYPRIVDFLCADLDFQRVHLQYGSPVACGKLTLLRKLLVNSLSFLNYLRQGRNFEEIIVFGHIGIMVRLLGRLRIIRYSKLFCLGFFVHSPRYFWILRIFLFDSPSDHYIVFSEHEVSLYHAYLRIDKSRMHHLRYVQWDRELQGPMLARPEDAWPDAYYFSGGYSNRDFLSLIVAFQNLSANLVIICSANNKELDDIEVPSNIKIFRDVSSERFNAFVQHAKAGIIPLKHNTGACGQSVMLRLMRYKKAVIASDIAVIRDYIDNGVTGFLVEDTAGELPAIVKRFEAEPCLAANMGLAAYHLYQTRFSSQAGFSALRQILGRVDEAAIAS